VVDGSNAYNWRPVPLWPGIDEPMQDFGGLQIPQRLMEAFQERGITQPSGIQSLAMPKLALGEHVVIHAPTGGGKTLAYLLPMLARLQPTLHVGLQALILVPTPELALQITREVRWLFEALCGPERVCWFNPQVPRELGCEVLLSRRSMWDAMRKDTAIIVSTPGIILEELKSLEYEARKFTETLAYFFCGNLNCILLDEVDAMFPVTGSNPRNVRRGAAEQVVDFLFDVIRNRYRNRAVQMVCASATANSHKVNKTLTRILASKWRKRRDVARRQTPVLVQHGARVDDLQVGPQAGGSWVEVPKCITHCLTPTSDEDQEDRFGMERLEIAARIIEKLEGTVLVFVPERVKLDTMVVFLREKGLTGACKYRAAVGLGQDIEQLADESLAGNRVARKKGTPPLAQEGGSEYALRRGRELVEGLAKGERRILVAKADTVRGMDLQEVRHVVLLYFPAMAMDYMHLAGRTGRMGRAGNVISIVSPMEKHTICSVVEVRLGIRFHAWDVEAGRAIGVAGSAETPDVPGEDGSDAASPAQESDAAGAAAASEESTESADEEALGASTSGADTPDASESQSVADFLLGN